MSARIKSLKEEIEKLQNLIVEISEERDEARFAVKTAETKLVEIESVCNDAKNTINDLVSQIHYWENKYKALEESKSLYEAVLEKCADTLYQVKNVNE